MVALQGHLFRPTAMNSQQERQLSLFSDFNYNGMKQTTIFYDHLLKLQIHKCIASTFCIPKY